MMRGFTGPVQPGCGGSLERRHSGGRFAGILPAGLKPARPAGWKPALLYCSRGSLVRNIEITSSETRIVMTVMINRR
jgi:hypothetical protein